MEADVRSDRRRAGPAIRTVEAAWPPPVLRDEPTAFNRTTSSGSFHRVEPLAISVPACEARAAMLGELHPFGGGDPIPLTKIRLLLGRRPTCDICLDFASVSAMHCELEWREGHWWLRDLDSRNGTRLNGRRCRSGWVLPGEVISIARHRFRLEYAAVGAAPQSEDDHPFAQSLLEKAGIPDKSRSTRNSPGKDQADDSSPRHRYRLE